MLSSVLRSDRAVKMNIAIMRAFVRLRDDDGLHGRIGLRSFDGCGKYLQNCPTERVDRRVSDQHLEDVIVMIGHSHVGFSLIGRTRPYSRHR